MQWPLALRVTSSQDSRHSVPAHARDPREQLQQQHLPTLPFSPQKGSRARPAGHIHSAQEWHTPYCRQLQLAQLGAIPNHIYCAPVVRTGRKNTPEPPWRNLSTKYTPVGSPTICKLWLKFYLPLFHTWLCTTKHPNSKTKDVFMAKELLH